MKLKTLPIWVVTLLGGAVLVIPFWFVPTLGFDAGKYHTLFSALVGALATILALIAGTFTLVIQQLGQNSPASVGAFPTRLATGYMLVLVLFTVVDGAVLLLLPTGTSIPTVALKLIFLLVVLHPVIAVSVVAYVVWLATWLRPEATIDYLVQKAAMPGNAKDFDTARASLSEMAATLTDRRHIGILVRTLDACVALAKALPERVPEVCDLFRDIVATLVSEQSFFLPKTADSFRALATELLSHDNGADLFWSTLRPTVISCFNNDSESDLGRFLSILTDRRRTDEKTLSYIMAPSLTSVLKRGLFSGKPLFVGHALEAITGDPRFVFTTMTRTAEEAVALVQEHPSILLMPAAYRAGAVYTVQDALDYLRTVYAKNNNL